jgi:hypothetical protein
MLHSDILRALWQGFSSVAPLALMVVIAAIILGFVYYLLKSDLRKLKLRDKFHGYFDADFSGRGVFPQMLKDAYDEFQLTQMEKEGLDQTHPVAADLTEPPTHFDPINSILVIAGTKISINRRGRNNNVHRVLNHVFQSPFDEHFYSEIAEAAFGDGDMYKDEGDRLWKTYYRACCDLRDRIAIEAGIKDFLTITTGRTGSIQINKDYLKK